MKNEYFRNEIYFYIQNRIEIFLSHFDCRRSYSMDHLQRTASDIPKELRLSNNFSENSLHNSATEFDSRPREDILSSFISFSSLKLLRHSTASFDSIFSQSITLNFFFSISFFLLISLLLLCFSPFLLFFSTFLSISLFSTFFSTSPLFLYFHKMT